MYLFLSKDKEDNSYLGVPFRYDRVLCNEYQIL